jgi:hypothetical protein
MNAQRAIESVIDEIEEFLLEKNRKYGNSALEPVRVMSKAATDEQIRVRIDDKLSRLQSGQLDDDEDVILDLIGYFILLIVHKRIEEEKEKYPQMVLDIKEPESNSVFVKDSKQYQIYNDNDLGSTYLYNRFVKID